LSDSYNQAARKVGKNMPKKVLAPIRRVFIVDPSFQDWVGHHAPYDLAIREGLEKIGVKTIILTNKKVAIENINTNIHIDKVFSRTSWGVRTDKYKIKKISHKILLVVGYIFLGFILITRRYYYQIRSAIEKLKGIENT
jgi:hypothetical protein